MKRSKHEYLVGYEGDNQCRYGKDSTRSDSNWVDPMTLWQAKRYVKRLDQNDKPRIFRLVPVRAKP